MTHLSSPVSLCFRNRSVLLQFSSVSLIVIQSMRFFCVNSCVTYTSSFFVYPALFTWFLKVFGAQQFPLFLSIFSTISLPECGASKLLVRNQRNQNEKLCVIGSSSIRTINHIRIFSTYRIRLLFKRIKMRRQIDFQISVYLSVKTRLKSNQQL